MEKSELDYFKNILQARAEQLKLNLANILKEREELSQSTKSDEADYASVNCDYMVENALILQHNKELEEIDQALLKIKEKTYGICEMCEEDIAIRRLKAKPYAKYCIVCREIIEKTKR